MRFISAVFVDSAKCSEKQAHEHQNNQFQHYFPNQLHYINLIYKVQKISNILIEFFMLEFGWSNFHKIQL